MLVLNVIIDRIKAIKGRGRFIFPFARSENYLYLQLVRNKLKDMVGFNMMCKPEQTSSIHFNSFLYCKYPISNLKDFSIKRKFVGRL